MHLLRWRAAVDVLNMNLTLLFFTLLCFSHLVVSVRDRNDGLFSSPSVCPPSASSDAYRVSFVAFVPCMNGSLQEGGCDPLIYPAIRQAVEDVNSMDTIVRHGVEKSFNISMNMTAIVTKNDPFEALFSFFTERSMRGCDVVGIIGPRSNPVTEKVAYIFGSKLPVVTVSYGATDGLFSNDSDTYSHFYRTIPSELAVNRARVCFTRKCGWNRVAVLASTDQQHYVRAATNLASQFDNVSLNYMGRLSVDAQPLFRKWLDDQYKIIFLLMDPLGAREVLCQARLMTDKKKRSLLDSTHVWILPQYVRSQWWEIDGDENDPLPNQYTTNCSDAAILDILNRINLLVLDSIKYNLRGSGDSGYQGAEYTLTRNWSSLITDVTASSSSKVAADDLRQSLMATAYDAVWALALSAHHSRTHTIDLNEDFQTLTFRGTSMDHNFSNTQESSAMFLLSQFRNGALYPVYLMSNVPGDAFSCGDNDGTGEVFLQVNSDLRLPGFNTSSEGTIHWKGGRKPTDGTRDSFISIPALVAAVIMDMVSFSLCAAFLIIMVIYKNNKYIKSSNVKFLLVALISYMTTIPTNILVGLIYSSSHYNLSQAFQHALCLLQYPALHTGWCITIIILIVKSLRVYKIFHINFRKTASVKGVSDFYLVAYGVVLLLPFLMLLVLLFSTNRPIPTVVIVTSSNGDLNWSNCQPNNLAIWQYGLLVYYLVLLLLLSYLGYSNSRVTLMVFKEEGQSCARSAIAVIICTLVFIVIYYPVNYQLFNLPLSPHHVLFWSVTAYVVASPVAIFGSLFVPKYVFIYRDYRTKMKETFRDAVESQKMAAIVEARAREKERLQQDLTRKNQKITYLKRQLHVSSSRRQFQGSQ